MEEKVPDRRRQGICRKRLIAPEKVEIRRLQKELKWVREEVDVLKKPWNSQNGRNEVPLMEREKATHTIKLMCEVLKLSRSGYYAWKNRQPSIRRDGGSMGIEYDLCPHFRGMALCGSSDAPEKQKDGFVPSMCSTGNCYDNAVMESFFHTLKTELIYFEKYQSKREAKGSVFEYIEVFYNRVRRPSALNYFPPAEFGERACEN